MARGKRSKKSGGKMRAGTCKRVKGGRTICKSKSGKVRFVSKRSSRAR